MCLKYITKLKQYRTPSFKEDVRYILVFAYPEGAVQYNREVDALCLTRGCKLQILVAISLFTAETLLLLLYFLTKEATF